MNSSKLLDAVFEKWTDFFKLDFTKSTYNLSEYYLYNKAKELQESRRLDLSGVTTFMLFKAFVVDDLKSMTISGDEYLFGIPDEKRKILADLHDLYSLVSTPEVDEVIEQFRKSVNCRP